MQTTNVSEPKAGMGEGAPVEGEARPAAKPSAAAKKATVSIEIDKLEAILNRLDRLESAANKAGLNRYDQAHSEVNPGTRAGIKTYGGKRITSYVMTRNVCEKINGIWHEDQQIELTYEDGSSEIVPYRAWVEGYKIEEAEIVEKKSKTRREDVALFGEYVAVLETQDGTRLSIGSKFLNG